MGNAPNLATDELAKHWLLNLAVEVSVRLVLLFPVVEGEALNVKPIPCCKTEDYARNLIQLFDAGMIRFSSEEPGDDVGSGLGVSRILERFLKLSEDDPTLRRDGRLLKPSQRYRLPGLQVSFELTLRGGEAWARVAEPNWTHILIERRDSISGELVSPNLDLVMAYMGWYPEINEEQIQLDTITLQTHSDFQILYWKQLPFVYRASFSLERAEARWVDREPKWFQEWWFSAVRWHKKPWELAGWPSE